MSCVLLEMGKEELERNWLEVRMRRRIAGRAIGGWKSRGSS
jgi:hypothetical protein